MSKPDIILSRRQQRKNMDFGLAVALGLVRGIGSSFIYGRTDNADNGALTDIWEGANVGAPSGSLIYVHPTEARTHQVTSSSTDDDAAGVGAQTVKIWGLTDWDTKEVTETVTMDGTNNVATTNQYVAINAMEVITLGGPTTNVGHITAIADTDNTLTAYIAPAEGRAHMAVFSYPSTQDFYITEFASSLQRNSGTGASSDLFLEYCRWPDSQPDAFIDFSAAGLTQAGQSFPNVLFDPPLKFEGPGILKLACIADINNTDITASLDGYLVDKE